MMMEDAKPKKHRTLKIVLCALAAIVVVACIGFGVYVGNFYHANDLAKEAVSDSGTYAGDHVDVEEVDGDIAFVPENALHGFIFYPGGKVEAAAYAPLMQDLAEREVLCVICPMPFNLAVFGIDAANGVQSRFPQVNNWYIGGHSLGGSMAAVYASKHASDFSGLVLLGSYSTEDLSGSGLRVLSIYGSNDGVMNRQKYDENKDNLPDATEHIIDGGNHAQFGSYGAQEGDGEATITPQAQWEETANAIVDWMKN